MQAEEKCRERMIWIDNVKSVACILVATGHFFQSMVNAKIIDQSALYSWFNQTIYLFHVPLFFICSGFLYQKFSKVNSYTAWKINVKKKLVILGIPYFVFSFATWILKSVFSGSVNSQVNSLFYDLFVHPLSPYWYLYALFFIFLITPTFTEKYLVAVWTIVAVVFSAFVKLDTYVLTIVTNNVIWFVIGVGICFFTYDRKIKMYPKYAGWLTLAVFLVSSIIVWYYSVESRVAHLILGMIACFGILIIFIQGDNKKCWVTSYTMPIFLMHTIFAAGLRSVLLKIGITSALIHIPAGLLVSFLGPIIATEVMQKIKLDFLLEPGKYIRIK